MKSLLIALLLISSSISFSQQIGIGTTNPDPSAFLDLTGTNKGLIIPRMTTADRDNNIKSPKSGILIFNTTTASFQVTGGDNKWLDYETNLRIDVATGTTTNTGNVGFGTATPDANTMLDIVSSEKGVLLPRSATDPVGVQGMLYYNTDTNKVKGYNGSTWISMF